MKSSSRQSVGKSSFLLLVAAGIASVSLSGGVGEFSLASSESMWHSSLPGHHVLSGYALEFGSSTVEDWDDDYPFVGQVSSFVFSFKGLAAWWIPRIVLIILTLSSFFLLAAPLRGPPAFSTQS